MTVDFRSLQPFRDYQIGKMLQRRLHVLRVAFMLGFIVFGYVFWYLQVVHGSEYRVQAEENRLKKRYERPPRGILIDDSDRVLVGNQPSFSVYMERDRSAKPREEVLLLARYLGEPPDYLLEQYDRQKSSPHFIPILLRPDVDIAAASRIEAHRPELPSIDVVMESKRKYLLGPSAAHVIGYLAEATDSDLKDRGDLMPGDKVGRAGVERAYDAELRGRPGIILDEVNALGRSLGTVAVQRPAIGGRALRVTLDGQMQRDLEESFQGRSGAAVFLDPITGSVRALYSGPSYDPSLFAGRLRGADWTMLVNNPARPLQNRVIAGVYPPGSTFKVVMAAATLEEHVASPEDTVFCPGHKNFYGREFHCHKKEGHGSVDVVEAVIRSCDVYFYTMGQRLEIDRIAKWAHKFGLGQKTGIELDAEQGGTVPSTEWKLKTRGEKWYAGETISVSIGQGQLQTTPIQLAVMSAVVANGGYRVVPHFVDRAGEAQAAEPIGLSPLTLSLLKQAMTGVVETDRGTARRARVPGVQMAGKTGTAQTVGREAKQQGVKDQGDNALFVGFGPVDKPRVSWCIVLENAGHGGEAAAPVAGIVVRRYLERLQVIPHSDKPEPDLGIDPPEIPAPQQEGIRVQARR